MSAKPELLEVTMAREVKALYFDTMRHSQEFHQGPFLDRDVFRRHFAIVAHQHRIFHTEGPEGRARYNLYYGLCWDKMKAAIRRLAKNEAEHHPPIQFTARSQPHQEAPAQPCSAGMNPDVAEARKRLALLRDELARRPAPQW
ncbi:MAG: hypothetical protein KBD27_03890 [Candidatus Moranbacteria bacterium]|nr:hypothetical protein [Candidatus Moranbacteria bacterium]